MIKKISQALFHLSHNLYQTNHLKSLKIVDELIGKYAQVRSDFDTVSKWLNYLEHQENGPLSEQELLEGLAMCGWTPEEYDEAFNERYDRQGRAGEVSQIEGPYRFASLKITQTRIPFEEMREIRMMGGIHDGDLLSQNGWNFHDYLDAYRDWENEYRFVWLPQKIDGAAKIIKQSIESFDYEIGSRRIEYTDKSPPRIELYAHPKRNPNTNIDGELPSYQDKYQGYFPDKFSAQEAADILKADLERKLSDIYTTIDDSDYDNKWLVRIIAKIKKPKYLNINKPALFNQSKNIKQSSKINRNDFINHYKGFLKCNNESTTRIDKGDEKLPTEREAFDIIRNTADSFGLACGMSEDFTSGDDPYMRIKIWAPLLIQGYPKTSNHYIGFDTIEAAEEMRSILLAVLMEKLPDVKIDIEISEYEKLAETPYYLRVSAKIKTLDSLIITRTTKNT